MHRLLAAALLMVALPAAAQDHSGHVPDHSDHVSDHSGQAMPATATAATGHEGHEAVAPGSPSAAYMDAMRGMDEAMRATPMTGQAGIDYARMMIPHHRSAVEMARAYLGSGNLDPVLRTLSAEIVASQEREIALLETWLRDHPAP